MLVSNKVPFGKKDFKYFIDYKDDKKQIFICNTSELNVYRRDFDEAKYVFFDKKLINW